MELVHLVLATTRAIWNLSIWYSEYKKWNRFESYVCCHPQVERHWRKFVPPHLPTGKGNRCSQFKNLATMFPTSDEQPHSLTADVPRQGKCMELLGDRVQTWHYSYV
jgi:hypothetical protein